MIVVQVKEELKIKIFRHSYHFFLYSMFVIQKIFKTVINKVLRITAALDNIH